MVFPSQSRTVKCMSVFTTFWIQNNDLVVSHLKITRFLRGKIALENFFNCMCVHFVICLQILSCKVHVFKLPPQILNAEKFLPSLSFLLVSSLLFFSILFCLPTCLFISYVIKWCGPGKLGSIKIHDVARRKRKIIKLYSVTVKHFQQK